MNITIAWITLLGVVITAYYAYRHSMINILLTRITVLEGQLTKEKSDCRERMDKMQEAIFTLTERVQKYQGEILEYQHVNLQLRDQLQTEIK